MREGHGALVASILNMLYNQWHIRNVCYFNWCANHGPCRIYTVIQPTMHRYIVLYNLWAMGDLYYPNGCATHGPLGYMLLHNP